MTVASGFLLGVVGPGVLLVLSIPLAFVGVLKLFKPIIHLGRLARESFEQFNGTPEQDGKPRQPGVVEALVGTNDRLDEQGQRLDSVERQLNGGGKITPALERLEQTTNELRKLAEDAAFQARQARLAAGDAHDEARELSVRMIEANDVATIQRGLIEKQIEQTADTLLTEMERRRIEAFRLLKEHGGPDLTDHVAPHTHSVSEPIDPPQEGT